jgi:hypothetical protein
MTPRPAAPARPAITRAARAATARARIAGLHTEPGGHSVHGGISFPFEAEADDEPIASPDDAQGWAIWGQVFLAAVTVACVGGVALAYLKS